MSPPEALMAIPWVLTTADTVNVSPTFTIVLSGISVRFAAKTEAAKKKL